jgi:hypothetical protein
MYPRLRQMHPIEKQTPSKLERNCKDPIPKDLRKKKMKYWNVLESQATET